MANNWGWEASEHAYSALHADTLQVSGLHGLGVANIGPRSGSAARPGWVGR